MSNYDDDDLDDFEVDPEAEGVSFAEDEQY